MSALDPRPHSILKELQFRPGAVNIGPPMIAALCVLEMMRFSGFERGGERWILQSMFPSLLLEMKLCYVRLIVKIGSNLRGQLLLDFWEWERRGFGCFRIEWVPNQFVERLTDLNLSKVADWENRGFRLYFVIVLPNCRLTGGDWLPQEVSVGLMCWVLQVQSFNCSFITEWARGWIHKEWFKNESLFQLKSVPTKNKNIVRIN